MNLEKSNRVNGGHRVSSEITKRKRIYEGRKVLEDDRVERESYTVEEVNYRFRRRRPLNRNGRIEEAEITEMGVSAHTPRFR